MDMKISPNDISNEEILEAIGAFASSVDERFARIEKVMATKDELRETENRIEREIGKLKTTMVTKGYLDDKLADLRSDIILNTDKKIEKALH